MPGEAPRDPSPNPSPQGGGEIRSVAVVDIGKTNAKVTLVRAADAVELAHRTVPNHVVSDGPYPHFDVAQLWDFILDSLAALSREAPIDAISLVTHGAAGAFIDAVPQGDGLALPVLDYEFTGPDELAEEYDDVRPGFAETLSPRLPAGLNLGAQIFWQERRFPEMAGDAHAYVTYPQYWTWRLSGVAATETCSLGCHTDLWRPRAATWSGLVERRGWQRIFAPLRPPFDVLGPVLPALAERLGLKPDTRILCGIHDSSASLLPHVIGKEPPFTVVSTGTWTIVCAVGGDVGRLDPKRDTLAYVTPFGDPVPAARFMGGREFEQLAGHDPKTPTAEELDRVIADRVMALPSFVPGVGPFPDRKGHWSHDPQSLTPGERTAAASLYLALMTAEAMACAGAGGPTIVEGPHGANDIFSAALSAITQRAVRLSQGTGGTSRGAACLVDLNGRLPTAEGPPVAPQTHAGLSGYVEHWRAVAG